MVGGLQRRGEVFDKWDIEVLELLGQSLALSWSAMDGPIRWFGVVMCLATSWRNVRDHEWMNT